ncbi:translation elongation factor EF-1 subunit alpha [Candidatus Micrarchaeota archaeon]|nr:translation elongation factor EF-1 subunit alpha [Candidatus Micrarchaeota archaeon]
MAEKPHLNLVFVGHIDHGKSTTVGRVLFDTGAVTEQQMRKLKEEASRFGKETFEFAYVMDNLKDERERGITIDVSHKDFQTNKYYFTIIDAPGHRDFVKNMITGASQADAGVLVVSAKEGIQAQTREHAFLAKVLGITQLLVAVNKMDTVNYSQDRYNEVVGELKEFMKKIGYDVSKIPYIPISSLKGDNVTKKSENTSWWDGKPLVEYFDDFTVPNKLTDKPLRLPVQDVYTITGHGTVPVGRVETGVLKPGMSVVINPGNVKTDVKKIEMHHQELKEANPGDNVGFNVKGVDKKAIKRGSVIGSADSPPTVAKEFTAQIIVLQHPTAFGAGYTPVFHIHTTQFPGTITEIVEKKGGDMEHKDLLKTGDSAIVKIRPLKPISCEKYQEFPPLGRFAIRDMGMTIAAGVIVDITEKV